MKYFIEIFLCLFVLFNRSEQDQRSLLKNNRFKRENTWPSPSKAPLNIPNEQCDQYIYPKLCSCSQFTSCTTLTICLRSIHCAPNYKSYGGLILNLLKLLGVDSCQNLDVKSTCPSDRLMVILRSLLECRHKNDTTQADAHYYDGNPETDSYCHSIDNFTNVVKDIITQQCGFYLRQVEAFLEKYLCPNRQNRVLSIGTDGYHIFNEQLHQRNFDGYSQNISGPLYTDDPSDYVDIDHIDSPEASLSTTEHTVYVDDHNDYSVSYIIPKSGNFPLHMASERQQTKPMTVATLQHRSTFMVNLSFAFPFYEHSIKHVFIDTRGFIYIGDFLHSTKLGRKQYIAPFMANFNNSKVNERSSIRYLDNGTHLICTWCDLYLNDHQNADNFTFQAILEFTGNIYFNYAHIPPINLSASNHIHFTGLSDMYMTPHTTNRSFAPTITYYNRIDLDREKIKTGTSIMFYFYDTCKTFSDCNSCLKNHGRQSNCTWCPEIHKCFDVNDRLHYNSMNDQCRHWTTEATCSNEIERISDASPSRFMPSSGTSVSNIQSAASIGQHSELHVFRVVVVTLLATVLIFCLLVLVAAYIYAYRNPTSTPGLWLIEHRPSHYIARFKDFSGINT